MKYLVLLIFAGLVLTFTGNTYAVLAGCSIALVGIITYAVASFFKENTGDIKGDLACLCSEHGGTTSHGEEDSTAAVADIGDVLKFQRGNREILFSTYWRRGSAAAGGAGGGLQIYINTPLMINKELDLRVGRKTLIRLGDRYAGSDCVFYGCEAIKENGKSVVVAGKDKNLFMAAVHRDRQLADAVEALLFKTGYDEFRIGTGGDKILKLGKRYARHDTKPEKVGAVIDAVVIIMDKLDTEEMAAKTKPHPPEKEGQKGISLTCIVVITIVIALFVYAMKRISSV